METDQHIFVGFEIIDENRDLFVERSSRDRVFMEDSAYLETVEIDGRKYIGKRAQSGAAVDRIEDTARNVVSLMIRVCPGLSLRPAEALIIGFEESAIAKTGALSDETDDEPEEKDDFDYGVLVD